MYCVYCVRRVLVHCRVSVHNVRWMVRRCWEWSTTLNVTPRPSMIINTMNCCYSTTTRPDVWSGSFHGHTSTLWTWPMTVTDAGRAGLVVSCRWRASMMTWLVDWRNDGSATRRAIDTATGTRARHVVTQLLQLLLLSLGRHWTSVTSSESSLT